MITWSKERLSKISLGIRTSKYKAIPDTPLPPYQEYLLNFEGLSIGDDNGQLCIIPLDDCSKETAEYILKAIKAYSGEQK